MATTVPQVRVWAVRHGESVWNRDGRLQGQSPHAPGLTAAGVAQAEATAARLAACGARVVLTSGLRRAHQTGSIIARALGVPLVVEPRLVERGLGVAEGVLARGYPLDELGVAGEVVLDPDAAPPGGESVRALLARVAGLLDELANGHLEGSGGVVLSTHGGVVRAVSAQAAGRAKEPVRWPAVVNGSVLEVTLHPGARRGGR